MCRKIICRTPLTNRSMSKKKKEKRDHDKEKNMNSINNMWDNLGSLYERWKMENSTFDQPVGTLSDSLWFVVFHCANLGYFTSKYVIDKVLPQLPSNHSSINRRLFSPESIPSQLHQAEKINNKYNNNSPRCLPSMSRLNEVAREKGKLRYHHPSHLKPFNSNTL